MKAIIGSMLLTSLLFLGACAQEDTQTPGEQIEEGAEDVQEGVERGADNAGDDLQDAGEDIEQGVEDAGDELKK
jgi:methyl-accepting chemotaxis protein